VFLFQFLSWLTISLSGAKIALRLDNSKAIRQRVPTQLTLRRQARTSLNTEVVARVAPCHPQVSGTGGSCNIAKHNLMHGQDPAPEDNPLPNSSRASAVLV
jgi:hypothetical protein